MEHTILDGIHPESGEKITHRRQWIAKRVGELRDVFAVEVLAVAVGEQEVDVVLTCLPEVAAKWSPEEVVWRWTNLFGNGFGILDRKHFSELAAKKTIVAEWRKRLTSVSWFMRGFNEWLARRINKEEERRGRFWDGRFRCGRVGKQDIKETVEGLEGHRLKLPPTRKQSLFPGIKALPESEADHKPVAKRRKRKVRGRWLTPDQKIEICRRLSKGESVADLAKEFNRSPHVISNLEKLKTEDSATIAGAKLNEAEKSRLRKLALRQKPRRARNGRLVYTPNDVHALAEKTFGRTLFHRPFEDFCRDLRIG